MLIAIGLSAAPSKPVVCIDPGHPSEVSRGTSGRRITEIAAAWKVASLLRKDLESRGVTVVMTKSAPEQLVTNRRRAEIANDAHADLMVRLHCDASNGTGFTTYFPEKQGVAGGVTGPTPSLIERDRPIAERFHQALAHELAGVLVDNGLKGDQYTAVGRAQGGALTGSIFSKVPVVLVEMVNLKNSHDEALICSASGCKRVADGLASATLAAIAQ
jgi:N-acetylmuramoyl-L-alanine amidase